MHLKIMFLYNKYLTLFFYLFRLSLQSPLSNTEWHKKKREILKNPTKIEELQEKKLLTEIEPLQLAF